MRTHLARAAQQQLMPVVGARTDIGWSQAAAAAATVPPATCDSRYIYQGHGTHLAVGSCVDAATCSLREERLIREAAANGGHVAKRAACQFCRCKSTPVMCPHTHTR